MFNISDNMPEIPPPSTAPRPHPRHGIYLIPAMFTLGNMALGFYSMVSTVAEKFGHAATAIIVSHILDILDGRVARWTRTESKFGIELDSLADFMSFCVAPAFMMYELVLKNNPVWGFPIALLFVICGALRLARFNLKAQMGEGKVAYFIGLPSPAAGGMLAVFVLLYDIFEFDKPARTLPLIMDRIPLFYQFVPAIMLLLALLMVSEVRYSTFKTLNLLRPRTMRALILTVLIILMIYVYPQNTIFIFYFSYIGWGLIDYFLRRKQRASQPKEGYVQDNYGK